MLLGAVLRWCVRVITILSLDGWHCFMIVVVALSEAVRPCRLQELAAAMTVEMRLLEFHNVHCRLHPLNRLNSSLKLMQPWRSSLIGAWPRNSGHWARGILAFKNKMATSWPRSGSPSFLIPSLPVRRLLPSTEKNNVNAWTQVSDKYSKKFWN